MVLAWDLYEVRWWLRLQSWESLMETDVHSGSLASEAGCWLKAWWGVFTGAPVCSCRGRMGGIYERGVMLMFGQGEMGRNGKWPSCRP